MTMKNNAEILKEFSKTRRLKKSTEEQYKIALKIYSEFNEKTLHELLIEAEQEEENGIRWKHRKLKKRLLNFRNYVYDNYVQKTAEHKFALIKTFYTHYEIEVLNLPTLNKKNIQQSHPINFKDLPDKKIIKQSLKIANPLMRAIILFMSSSGCARTETLNLTIADYLNATRQYHNTNDISKAISLMYDKDIIPTFFLPRQKTNKTYFTFCSPEANTEIINYLLTRENLSPEDKLFKSNKSYFERHFARINTRLNLGKVGAHNRFKSHMLRKFHASRLYNDGMSLEEIDALQGRGKDPTHTAYFLEDPDKLREKYIQHMDAITINLDVNNLDIKSPEYVKLETEIVEKDEKIENYEKFIQDIDKRLRNIEEKDDNFTENDFEDLLI